MSANDSVLARYTYDPEEHSLYLRLVPDAEGRVAATATVPAVVHADLDEDGQVVGMEIIHPWPTSSAVPEVTN